MTKFLFLAVLVAGFQFSNAQKPNVTSNGFTISARVVDGNNKQPIEYATVSLLGDSSKKIINGSISNKRGALSLQHIPTGKYHLLIQFMGYEDYTQQITLNADLGIGEILLHKKAVELSQVTVTSKRQVIENKIDKMVYNVEKDISSQGGIATDALKKIPGVSVDIDGNVELMGNPSIKFLIDGKPSAIFGNSIADALQSIPNSQIQSIEVITSPSSKYDASGTGGIINIILKKSKVEGFNGSVHVAAGTRLENGSMNLAFKKSSFAVNGYFSGNGQLNSVSPNGSDRITTPLTNRFIQDKTAEFNRDGYKSGIGMEWTLSSTETVSAAFGINHFGNNSSNASHQQSINYDATGNTLNKTLSDRLSGYHNDVSDYENSLTYRKKFKQHGREFELAYNATYGNNTNAYHQEQFLAGSAKAFTGSNSSNPGKENQINVELNYTHPINEKVGIETGLRNTQVDIISGADVFTLNATTSMYALDTKQSYQSEFKRDILAAYFSMNFPLGKFLEAKAGMRYEYTFNKANYSNAPNTIIPDFHHLIPSVILAHHFDQQQILKFAYTFRIERPEFMDLNPFMNLSDPHNITTGNPNLKTEVGNRFELTYSKNFEAGGNINITAIYQRNSPDIKPYVSYYPSFKIGDSVFTDVIITTRETIASEVRTGISIAGSVSIGKKLTIRPNFQMFNRHLNNPNAVPATMDGFGVRGNLNASYQIAKELAAEFFGNYNSGIRWQGKQPDVYSYTFAIRKQFGTKASIGFVAVNPFNEYVKQYSQQKTEAFVSDIWRFTPYRSFGITCSYKFGMLKFKGKDKEGDLLNYNGPENN